MNRNDKQAYDRGTLLFSPDGRIYQAEYAREATKCGAPVLGARTADGVVLAALRSTPPELMEAESTEKLHKLDDAFGAAMTGHVADTWKLMDLARTAAQRKYLRHGEPTGVETLTKTVTDNIQESVQPGGIRPYGVSLLIGGAENGSGCLFATGPSGTPQERKTIIIGGHCEDVQAVLEDSCAEDLPLEDGLALVVEALVVTDKEIESDELNLVTVSEVGYETVDEEIIAELFADATADDESDETDKREEQITDGSPTDDNTSVAEAEATAAAAVAADVGAGAIAGAAVVTLDRIVVYPVKSLDVEFADAADIVENGEFCDGREYTILDEDNEYVNGKRERAVPRTRSSVSPVDGTVELSAPEMDDYSGSIVEADGWLSAYFGYPVELRCDPAGGLPDDIEASGPTVTSTGTLDAAASWFDGVDVDEMRRRLRLNLVFNVSEPFWEDHLFDRCGTVVKFNVDRVVFEGVNPCQRCVVPSRDPDMGTEMADFRTTFMTKRRETLPEWSGGDWFDHDFRLIVNTVVPESS